MSADRQRLIDLIAGNLYFLVKQPMTRDEAIDLKKKVAHPISLLNSTHNLRSEARAKEAVRRGHGELLDT